MKTKIIIPAFISFTLLLMVNYASAQTNETDTTKKIPKVNKTEFKKKRKESKKDNDTTQPQNKITVNEDGIMVRKKVDKKKMKEVPKEEENPELKNKEKTIEPKKKD